MREWTKQLVVPLEIAGMRIDNFLVRQFPDLSRSRCQQLIRGGLVRVNGVVVAKPSFILKGGEQVTVHLPEPEPTDLLPEPAFVPVLYEDDDFLVVDKPRGMVVHPGAGVRRGTLVNALLAMGISLSDIAGSERRGIVHRLDKGTSGVMVVAKTNFAHLHLSRQFSEHTVDKRYLAVVVGEPATPTATRRFCKLCSPRNGNRERRATGNRSPPKAAQRMSPSSLTQWVQ